MLHHLLQLAGDSEPGFAAETIRWQVELSPRGKLLGVLPLGDGKRGEVHKKVPKMHNMNAGGRSHFLVETAQTISLYFKKDEDDKKKQATREKHRFYVQLIEEASERASLLKGLSTFLSDKDALKNLREQLTERNAKPSDWLKFTVGDNDPLADEIVTAWWRQWRADDLKESSSDRAGVESMLDLLTADSVAPADTQPKVVGLASVGGLPTGDVVAGFDKDAFTSYGLEQARNAAMSEATARGYVDALNGLIRDSGIRLADTIIVHWFKERLKNNQEDPLYWLVGRETTEEQAASAQTRAKELLNSIHSGERSDLANNRYYAMALSGAAGRVMVRAWIDGAFEALVTSIQAWFDDLAIVSRDGDGLARDPKFMAVAGALVRELDDLHSDTIAPLWRAATGGSPIPHRLLAQATLRARLDVINDNQPNHARMGLLKAYFVRNQKGGDQTMTAYLNPEHPDPAYHCGRLLAVLNSLQRAALGDVGAGVVQRYYTAASQTPALIIGRLMGNAKNHLGKLEGGLAYWYENKIADVMSRIRDSAPRTLDLEHQSLFALGYYQQLANDRAGRPNTNKEE